MKTLILLMSTLLLLTSCVKPSYKKNEIIKSEETSSESDSGFFEIPSNQELTADQQIAAALFAAPSKMREGAKVFMDAKAVSEQAQGQEKEEGAEAESKEKPQNEEAVEANTETNPA